MGSEIIFFQPPVPCRRRCLASLQRWKYCLLCSANGKVVAEASEDSGEGEDVVTHRMSLDHLLVPTDQEILESFDKLEEKFHTLPKGEFQVWQQTCGLTYSKYALLLDKQLRSHGILQPAQQYCHDWMHGLVSAGWSLAHDYLKLWLWPKHLPQNLADLFGSKHAKKCQSNKKIQCQASEALSLLPVLVCLVKSLLLPQGLLCPKICNAFLAAAAIVDLVHLGQVWDACSPTDLKQTAENCFIRYISPTEKNMDWIHPFLQLCICLCNTIQPLYIWIYWLQGKKKHSLWEQCNVGGLCVNQVTRKTTFSLQSNLAKGPHLVVTVYPHCILCKMVDSILTHIPIYMYICIYVYICVCNVM